MRTRFEAARVTLLVFVAAATLLTLTACGGGTAASAGPDITGIVWRVSGSADDGSASLYVVGLQGGAGSYDRASVAVTPSTAWFLSDGNTSRSPLERELVGRRVAVTCTGAVAESYPVQATASRVRLLEPLGVSTNATPAGIPQVHGEALGLVRDAAGSVVAFRLRKEASGTEPIAVPVSAETTWLLATPTEFKPAQGIPLIGNGLEPVVDVRLEGGAAVWVAVFLPR